MASSRAVSSSLEVPAVIGIRGRTLGEILGRSDGDARVELLGRFPLDRWGRSWGVLLKWVDNGWLGPKDGLGLAASAELCAERSVLGSARCIIGLMSGLWSLVRGCVSEKLADSGSSKASIISATCASAPLVVFGVSVVEAGNRSKDAGVAGESFPPSKNPSTDPATGFVLLLPLLLLCAATKGDLRAGMGGGGISDNNSGDAAAFSSEVVSAALDADFGARRCAG